MPVVCYTKPLSCILDASKIVELHFWFLLADSVNLDLLEHLPFGILEGGVEDFIE